MGKKNKKIKRPKKASKGLEFGALTNHQSPTFVMNFFNITGSGNIVSHASFNDLATNFGGSQQRNINLNAAPVIENTITRNIAKDTPIDEPSAIRKILMHIVSSPFTLCSFGVVLSIAISCLLYSGILTPQNIVDAVKSIWAH